MYNISEQDLAKLDIPTEPITPLAPPQIATASQTLLERLNNSPPDEKRQHLHAVLHSVRAERVGNVIFALISYYFPPPFDFAPTGVTMLPITQAPVGAHRYRQLFTVPVNTAPKKETRS